MKKTYVGTTGPDLTRRSDLEHEITHDEARAAEAIANEAIRKASELRANPYVLMLAVVTLHEEARRVSSSSEQRGDELFAHLVGKLRAQGGGPRLPG